jgi:hypothetical protein
MPYLCRLERSKIERGAHVGHAWNTIKFYGDVDQEGQQKSYTVDLMHQVGSKLNPLLSNDKGATPKER